MASTPPIVPALVSFLFLVTGILTVCFVFAAILVIKICFARPDFAPTLLTNFAIATSLINLPFWIACVMVYRALDPKRNPKGS